MQLLPDERASGELPSTFKLKEWLVAAGASLIVALAIVSPFWRLSNASGHDISFHAASWLEVASQWKQGILLPRWAEWANFGYGEPRFVFYPPLSWLLGAGLVTLLPIKAVAGAFIVVTQTFAGISAYALARKFADVGGALCGAMLFVANPYALLNIYVRSDYAELLAIAFFPLVLLGALRLCDWVPGTTQPAPRMIAFFALGFAAVWLSNAPAAVVLSYSMALLFGWAAVADKSSVKAIQGAAGMALGLGLASFYVIPAAYEQRWVNIADALSAGLKPEDNFLFTRINDADHNHFNRIASWMAVLLLVFTVIFATLLWRKILQTRDLRAAKSSMSLILLATIAGLLMESVSRLLWEILPKLRFVQFPWRWMSIVAVIFSLFAAGSLSGAKRAWMAMIVMLLALVNCGVYLGKNTWWDGDDFPSIQYELQLQNGYEGTDEYDPLGDDHTDLKQKQPTAQLESGTGRIDIRTWTAEHRTVEVSTERADRLLLRLVDYPGWKFTRNGVAVPAEHLSGVKAVVLPVEAGATMVEAKFTRTKDRTIGGAASLASLLIAGTLIAVGRKRQPES